VSAFIDAHRDRFGVEPVCREIEVSASAYRARRTRPPSLRARRDEYLLRVIKRVHAASGGVYGQLKVWDELRGENVAVARCTVERLMRAHGLEGVSNGKVQRTTLPGLSPVAADDLVRRNFTALRPDAVWLSDFTYIRTWEGWSYLSVVLDVHTRRIVGWQLASHMRQSLVSDALEMAIAGRKERYAETVAHSDNGSQYTSYEYTERLKRAGIAPSRGRTGTALDNAMAESIMSTLKRELTKRYTWRTRLDLELALVSYIGWYNARRKHRSLRVVEEGRIRRLSPLEMLERYNQKVATLVVASN
jgi:putative transposase